MHTSASNEPRRTAERGRPSPTPLLLSPVVLVLVLLPGTPAGALTPCGGENERGCCLIGPDRDDEGLSGPCSEGLVQVRGCAGDCKCSGDNGADSSGTCVRPTPCGGLGQRACCTAAFERTASGELRRCEDDLTPVDGCSGDCLCGKDTAGFAATSLHMCTRLVDGEYEPIAEPEPGWTPPAPAPMCPFRGYADLHLHMLSQLGFGGVAISGTAVPFGHGHAPQTGAHDVNGALRPDFGIDWLPGIVNKKGEDQPEADCPADLPDCGHFKFHGDHILGDVISFFSGDVLTSNFGAPIFSSWPTWKSVDHQQVYYRWLERAWRGGLRLMVMMAVTNEGMCQGGIREKGTDCADSMGAIEQQVFASFETEAFIDAQWGGPGRGWFRIVRTPAEARRVVADGKLAVVLGVEVDNPFNCKMPCGAGVGDCESRPAAGGVARACDADHVAAELDRFHALGLRHVFPVHNVDNAFSGTALFIDEVQLAQRYSEGEYFVVEDCSADGYGFQLSRSKLQLMKSLNGHMDIDDDPPHYEAAAMCNAKGLTALGESLVGMLMDRGMVIDLDHMSRKAVQRTLELAEARRYPVVASHAWFMDLNRPENRSERMLTRADLARIKALGGLVGPVVSRVGPIPEEAFGDGWVSSVADDCFDSSRSWAQALQYASAMMDGPVGFGSDFGAPLSHLAPRFGKDACKALTFSGERDPEQRRHERSLQYRQSQRLSYPFTLDGFGTLDRQVTGHKTFDYNVDGLAHVGLLPDMVADLKTVGVPGRDLDRLFGSAEAYIELWERATGTFRAVPKAVCESVTVAADASCRAPASIAVGAPAEDPRVVVSETPGGSYALGTHEVSLAVTEVCGDGTTTDCSGTVTVVDETAPAVTCPSGVTIECGGSVVTRDHVQAQDNCVATPPVACSPASVATPGTTPVGCSASDAAGNEATCAFQVTVRDTVAPSVVAPAGLAGVECTSPHGASPALGSPVVSDGCDSSPAVSHDAPAVLPVGSTVVTWTARDDAGNTGRATQGVTVVDTTPPAIACPAPVTAECSGGRAAVVTPGQATASDLCSTPAVAGPAAGSYPRGTTAVTYTATDGAGLDASCGATIEVVDTTPPVVACPPELVAECTGGGVARVTPGPASGADACAGTSVTSHGTADFPVGTTALAYTATDEVGLAASCSANVRVVDTTPPRIACPARVVEECTGGSSARVTPGTATGEDACAGVTVSGHPAADFPLGATLLTYTATDDAGLRTECAAEVLVVDTRPPELTCPEDLVVECTAGRSAHVTPGAAVATDACDAVQVSGHDAAWFPFGETELLYQAVDGVGLPASCTSRVTVVDSTPPAVASLRATPDTLFPPDRKLVDVAIEIEAREACDVAPPQCRIVAITSDEPAGSKAPAHVVTGPLTARLRAERDGDGDGRTYTVRVACVDQGGNTVEADTFVRVPRDQRRR